MLDFDTLMAPLDGPTPAGPDLRSEPEFRDIEDMPGGFANQKAQELRLAIASCEAFLARTKDQMPAIVALQAAVRIGDFTIANAALALIHGFADQYWDDFHPGPAEEMTIGRINELSALSRPAAMTLPLQRALLASMPAPSTTGFTAAMIALACQPTPEWSDNDEEMLRNQVEKGQMTGAIARQIRPNRDGARMLRTIMRCLSSAARAADDEAKISMDEGEADAATRQRLALDLRAQVEATRAALQAMSDMLYTINEVYDSRAGDSASLGPVLAVIKTIVGDCDRFVATFPASEASEAAGAGEAAAAGAEGMVQAAGGVMVAAAPLAFVAGVPRNRDDVKSAIDAICAYYTDVEPSSPVVLLLKRARTWINKDFMELVGEMAPSAMDDVQRLLASPEQ